MRIFSKGIAIIMFILVACSKPHRDNGWYPVDESNKIEGEMIVSTEDFDRVFLDTLTANDIDVIQGVLKQDKIPEWTNATEHRIGKRIGFVFNDSVIMAPTVNCRIESGSFSINSSDKQLILEIYKSLNCKKGEVPDVMPQKSYATTEGITMRIVNPTKIKSPVDSIVVELTNSRDIEGQTGEWFRIEKITDNGKWEEIPLNWTNANFDGTINVVFKAVAWIVYPGKPLKKTINLWFYDHGWSPGTYRIAKTFDYPPFPRIEPSDTVYVEFQIK